MRRRSSPHHGPAARDSGVRSLPDCISPHNPQITELRAAYPTLLSLQAYVLYAHQRLRLSSRRAPRLSPPTPQPHRTIIISRRPYWALQCPALSTHMPALLTSIRYDTIRYDTQPHHTVTTPYHTTPNHVIPHHTTPHHTTPYHTIPHHTTPPFTTPNHTTPHNKTHHTTPHHTTP